jgi:hypothetical protein
MTDKNIYEIISSTLNVQVSMFKNDIEEKKKKNNFFFINDHWIVGYVYGYCQTSYNLQKEKSLINFHDLFLNTFVNNYFIEKKSEDFDLLIQKIKILSKDNNDPLFVNGFKSGVDEVILFFKDKKIPAKIFEHLDNIFKKNNDKR